MPYKDPAKRAAWVAANKEKIREHKQKYKKSPHGRETKSRGRRRNEVESHRFVGVDGEGYTDALGQHHYMCLIAGDDVLYTGEPLTSQECLEFLSRLPVEKGLFYVGFFFDYDSTMILRDMVQEVPEEGKLLLNVKPRDEGERNWWEPRRFGTWIPWRGYGIDYVPKKHIRVCRYLPEKDEKGNRLKTPAVEVHDVRNFYQTAFVNALNTFGVGSVEQREFIASMKAERSEFDPAQAEQIIEYSKMECKLLAEMVGILRDAFLAANLSPAPYEGPGPVAGRVLAKYVTGKERQEAMKAAIPTDVWGLAEKAYYGGRFEVMAHGSVGTRVWEYDIKSAYPDAMTLLPCLEHGRWEPGNHGELWIGEIAWDMEIDIGDADGVMGPLPVRRVDATIHFPIAGRGWYWSVEIPPYAEVVGDTWSYITECDCVPFEFVADMYTRRAEMEKEHKGSGIGLKLTLNSLYGKLAQRIGSAPHYNPVWAGLITAMTRAKVYSVYLNHPRKVVMAATDAVFLIEEAPELDIGSKLGMWEIEGPYDEFCIFQPGVYFDGGQAKFKTRGVPKKQFAARAEEFREAANDFSKTVLLELHNHLGLKLALSWGEDWIPRIGNWIPLTKEMNAAPASKRTPNPLTGGLVTRDKTNWSLPWYGGKDIVTVPYQHDSDVIVFEEELLWQDGLPDGTD